MSARVLAVGFFVFFNTLCVGQVPRVTRYGYGCEWNTNICLGKNDRLATTMRGLAVDNRIFIRVTVPSNQTLNASGFVLKLRSELNPAEWVRTYLHDASGTAPGPLLIAGQPVFVTSTEEWIRCYIPTVTLQPGRTYYLAYDNPTGGVALGRTTDASGLDADWYRRPAGGGLVGPMREKWQFRILCDGKTPNLQTAGSLPIIGGPFTIRCDDVPPPASQPAIFMLSGGSYGFQVGDQDPIALGGIGAPQCEIYVHLNPAAFALSDAASSTTRSITFWIPLDPALIGTRGCGQWAVFAPGANPLGAVFSNAGEFIIG